MPVCGPPAESGIELRGEVPLLRRALALQLRESGVHLVNLLIELVQAILGFAQFAGRGGDRLFLRFELGEQACALLLLLLNRPLPRRRCRPGWTLADRDRRHAQMTRTAIRQR